VKQWTCVEDVLDFAIAAEEAAVEFYTRLAGQMAAPAMREALEGFAREEMGHKAKLLGIKAAGGGFGPSPTTVMDLKIADYMVDVKPGPDMQYADALVVAMKKEKAAFRLYTDLAAMTEDEGLKAAFAALAQEEAKHKLRFEIEYDDMLAEN